MAMKLKGQGANGPGSYWPIRSKERLGPGAKRLGAGVQQQQQQQLFIVYLMYVIVVAHT